MGRCWFKFNNLGIALGVALAKDCGKRLALWQKESKLKVRKSREVIPRFVEVARGKTGRKLEAYLEPS